MTNLGYCSGFAMYGLFIKDSISPVKRLMTLILDWEQDIGDHDWTTTSFIGAATGQDIRNKSSREC